MKRRINIYLIVIAAAAALLTMLVTTFVIYDIYHKQVQNDLRSIGQIIQCSAIEGEEESEIRRIKVENLRLTWINETGEVLFDNDVDIKEMTNHLERPEIAAALKYGEGDATRRSETLQRNTYYYAIRLNDGSVLRVSREADNIYSFLGSVFPLMTAILASLIILCVIVAHFMTQSIIHPIEKLASDLDGAGPDYTYKEMVPIIETIRGQHTDILKASTMRRAFTANISHELKTPLTAISGYAELMENGMVEESQMREFAEKINKNSSRLLKLIDDVLRLSQLDETESTPSMEYFDLLAEAEYCVEGLKDFAQQNNVSITCSGESVTLHANRDMIEELINNLCVNAVRYNKKNGEVKVSVHNLSDQPVLTVEDTGIGIPQEHQSRIFERFYRVDKSRSKKSGGTGLGLAIVKHIVEFHNATIILNSAEGEGTQIRILF